MKRWVWLGLVGGLVACNERKPLVGPVEPQDCLNTSASAQPGTPFSSLAQALSPEEQSASKEGRQPVIIRYQRTLSSSVVAVPRAVEDAVVGTGGKVTARWARLGAMAAWVTPEERKRLEADPNVLSVDEDRPVRAFNLPSRQPLVTSGTVGEYTEGIRQIQADKVWDSNGDGVIDANAHTGGNIKVCVIDSGWDNRHPELMAAYVGGKDFIDDDDEPLDREYDKLTQQFVWGGGHGTHTAATIVAQLSSPGTVDPLDDQNGVVGVAPGVDLLVARVLNVRGTGNTSDIIKAVEWCQSQGAKIASLSLGSDNPDETERLAFATALNGGMLSIAASGNSGETMVTPAVAFPAAYPSVLAVGAVNFKNEHEAFSQRGPELSLVAPGVGVLSASILRSETAATIEADGVKYRSRSLAFAPLGDYAGKLLTCGIGNSAASCGEQATCEGFVAYVDRGGLDSAGEGLTFAKKVDFMRRAGARAVIIGNNDPDDDVGNFTLGEGEWVPTASVSYQDGLTIKALGGKDASVKLFEVDYARLTGTSMAAPHVAGVAALLWSARPTLAPGDVRKLMEDTALDLGGRGWDNAYGHGLVQAKAAMNLLQQRYPQSP
ncbi:MAG TPA: S8 family serine peptidase [Myxococcaceae bacterium]|jgi:subtilisin family serine protease